MKKTIAYLGTIGFVASLLVSMAPAVYAAAPNGTLTGTVVTVKVGELKTLPNITVTDAGAEVVAANDVFIRIPAGVNAVFDQTVTAPTMTPSGTITVNAAVTYLNSKTVHIDITADATATNTLLISGLKIIGNTANTGATALDWSVDAVGGGGTYLAGNANTQVTVNGANDVVTPTATLSNNGVSVAGASYTINTTLPAGGVIPPNGIITLTFPANFDVSGATISTTHPGMDGTFAATGIAGQVLTLTRTGGGTNAVAGAIAVTIGTVTNINAINNNYVIGVKTSISTGAAAVLSASVNTAAFQVAPLAIANLSCISSGSGGAVWLRWTAPTGVTAGYEARTSLATITSGNYGTATIFTQAPAWVSGTAGVAQQQLVTGLAPNNVYFFNVEALGANTTNSMIANTVNCTAPASATVSSSATGSTDSTAPTSSVTDPFANQGIVSGGSYTIKGTSSDTGGSSVAKVEISTSGGTAWVVATPETSVGTGYTWSYVWSTPSLGSYTIKTRATDGYGNIEVPSAGTMVTVGTTSTLPSITVTTGTTTGTTPTITTSTAAAATIISAMPYANPVGAAQIEADVNYLQEQLLILLQQLLASLQAQLAGH
jgi:hypothetical protein